MQLKSSTKHHYIKVLSKLFDKMHLSYVNNFFHESKLLYFDTGEIIIHQGEIRKTLFIVLSGRCRAILEREGSFQILGDVSEGELIGEYGLFTGEARTSSVCAIRPSVLLEVNEDTYLKIVGHQPQFANQLTSILLKRLERNNLQKHLQTKPKNIAVLNLQADNDIGGWISNIKVQFETTHTTFNIYDYNFQQSNETNKIFENLEENEGLNFLVCSEVSQEWSKQCLIYSDLVILAVDFYADSDIYNIENLLNLHKVSILNKKIYLLLLHPENAPMAVNTKRWFINRNIDLHIHLRKNNSSDTARFCRIITHKAIGIVLGGGGAKGFAHVGAIKALLHCGIPIDFLGGTSAGALYGLSMSFCDFQQDKIDYYTEISAKKKLLSNDYTFPIVSLLTGTKLSNFLTDLLGTTCIEDFWIPSYCVSSNLTSASIEIHKSGLAWKKIMASSSIPGVFPPVIINRELHVDGGVMDNLPIEAMFSYPVNQIVAVALSSLNTNKLDIKEIPTTSSLIWDKLWKNKKYKLPSLASIIINSLTLNSTQKQERSKSNTSIFLNLNLKGSSLLDDTHWKLIVQKGYDQTLEYIENLDPSDKFW